MKGMKGPTCMKLGVINGQKQTVSVTKGKTTKKQVFLQSFCNMYNHKLSFPTQNRKTTANQVFTFLIMSPRGKLGLAGECEAFVMYMNFASFAIHLSFGWQTLQW